MVSATPGGCPFSKGGAIGLRELAGRQAPRDRGQRRQGQRAPAQVDERSGARGGPEEPAGTVGADEDEDAKGWIMKSVGQMAYEAWQKSRLLDSEWEKLPETVRALWDSAASETLEVAYRASTEPLAS